VFSLLVKSNHQENYPQKVSFTKKGLRLVAKIEQSRYRESDTRLVLKSLNNIGISSHLVVREKVPSSDSKTRTLTKCFPNLALLL